MDNQEKHESRGIEISGNSTIDIQGDLVGGDIHKTITAQTVIINEIRSLTSDVNISGQNKRIRDRATERALAPLVAKFEALHDDNTKLDERIRVGEQLLAIDPDHESGVHVGTAYGAKGLVALVSGIVANRQASKLLTHGTTEEWYKFMMESGESKREAVSLLSRAVSLNPKFHRGFFWLGRAHISQAQWISANQAFTSAINLHRIDGKYFLWRARALMAIYDSQSLPLRLVNRRNYNNAMEDVQEAKKLGVRLINEGINSTSLMIHYNLRSWDDLEA
jgi:hypothetical protein